MLCQFVRLVQVMICYFRLGLFMSGLVMLVLVSLCKDRLVEVRYCYLTLGHVGSGKVGLGQVVMLGVSSVFPFMSI